MLLDVEEWIHQTDTTPTIQYRVDVQILESFSGLAEHYKCSNSELITKSLKQRLLKKLSGALKWAMKNF